MAAFVDAHRKWMFLFIFIIFQVKYVLNQEHQAPNFGNPRYDADVPGIMQQYKQYKAMRVIPGAEFYMGVNDPKSQTGEHPLRQVKYRSFYMDAYPVTNAEYWEFRRIKWRYKSTAEKKGWSWVLSTFVSDEVKEKMSSPGASGWLAVRKARWNQPFGPGSSLEGKWNHPVTHVSYEDARIYCNYRGHRTPTETEWEAAARGGKIATEYPWGDMWEKYRMNEWQGDFPFGNLKHDGYDSTSPVDAYVPQTPTGMYDFLGNVWEWTGSKYLEKLVAEHLQPLTLVLKGGSYVDSRDGKTNFNIRTSQRKGEDPEHTAGNVGFRCAMSAHHFDTDDIRPKPKPQPKEPLKPKVYRKPKAQPEKKVPLKNFGPPDMGVHPRKQHEEL